MELGAQWIGDTHHRMFALAGELGVETYPQYEDGETSYELTGSGVLRENEFHTRYHTELANSNGCCADSTNSPPKCRRTPLVGAARRRVGCDHRRLLV